MRFISTQQHCVLDYLFSACAFSLPRAAGWSGGVNRFLTRSAAATAAASALTRYELGLVKVVPMKGHLAFDLVLGSLFLAAARRFPSEDRTVRATLAGLGVFSFAATLLTKTDDGEG